MDRCCVADQYCESALKGKLWLKHVKGHSSHKWNDRADALADEGRLGTLRTAEAEPECVD